MSRECWEFGRFDGQSALGMCRVAKDRGRINSSAGRCLTLRCTQTPPPLNAFRCRAAPHSPMQGQLCRGGYWGPEWPLASPGWVVWACAPCATPALAPPLLQSSGGCSRRPRCVWPPVWPRLCLVSALLPSHHYYLPPPTLACLLACLQALCIICTCPAACCNPCLPGVQLLPADTQRCPFLWQIQASQNDSSSHNNYVKYIERRVTAIKI